MAGAFQTALSLLPITFILLFLLNRLNDEVGVYKCSSVKSYLGSLEEIKQTISVIPFNNKVTALLSCRVSKTEVRESRVTLPLSYCPNNFMFNRVSAMEEYIDRHCAPPNRAEIVQDRVIRDENSEPILITDANIYNLLSPGKDGKKFNPTLNLGLKSWLESRERSERYWAALKVEGLNRNLVVFIRPAAIIASAVLDVRPVTADGIKKVQLASSDVVSKRFIGYFVSEFIGHGYPFRVFYITSDTEVDNCSICLEGQDMMSPMIHQPCGHGFHRDCIDRWLLQGSNTCPQCRQQIRK
jgi:hypothetical protein